MSTSSSSSSTTNNTLSITPTSAPKAPELARAIYEFQRVLWTPSIEKATNILNEHPLVLFQQNAVGFLPLHTAITCTKSAYRSDTIKLIIEKGMEHNVGGTSGRGGLTIRSKDKHRTALCLLVVGDDKTDILEYLVKRDPPLLTADDVVDFNLLHQAARDASLFSNRFPTLKFLIDLCPHAFGGRNRDGDLPIHQVCRQPGYSYEILEFLLNESISHGVCLEKNGDHTEFLNCCRENHILDLLKTVTQTDAPILHGVIGVVPSDMFKTIINTFQNFAPWCHVRDKRGRLPIHVAAIAGLPWDGELSAIVFSSVYTIGEKDPVTGLYPFLLTASSEGKQNGCDLNSIYQIARLNPSCVRIY
jgi:ankyrin repeat protein